MDSGSSSSERKSSRRACGISMSNEKRTSNGTQNQTNAHSLCAVTTSAGKVKMADLHAVVPAVWFHLVPNETWQASSGRIILGLRRSTSGFRARLLEKLGDRSPKWQSDWSPKPSSHAGGSPVGRARPRFTGTIRETEGIGIIHSWAEERGLMAEGVVKTTETCSGVGL